MNVESAREMKRREVAAAFKDAMRQSDGEKPHAKVWMAGPCAETVTHLVSCADGTVSEFHGSAVFAMLDCGFNIDAAGAGQLLLSIGVWPERPYKKVPAKRSSRVRSADE